MGLDMYMYKTKKGNCKEFRRKILNIVKEYEKGAIKMNGHLLFINPQNYPDPLQELNPIAYWRKANHIHMWFSKIVLGNTGNKEKRVKGWVSQKQLTTLLQHCKSVLDHCTTISGELVIDVSYCKKMFPAGFHILFGGLTDYDERFIDDIKNTIAQINSILLTTDFEQEAILYFAYY